MDWRETLYQTVRTFFILVTLITVAMFALGSAADAGRTFSYDAFLTPLLYALVGALPQLVMASKEELSGARYVVRKVIQFAIIEAGIVALVLTGPSVAVGESGEVAALMSVVAVVFVVAHALIYLADWHAAKKMTEGLAQFK